MHEPNRLLQSASLFLVLLIAIASAFAQASPANSQELATLVEDLQSTNDDIRRTAGNSLFERLESDYQMMVTMLVPITSSSSEQTRYDSAKLLFAGSLLSVGNAQIATSLISTYRSLALDTSARVSVVGIEAFSFLPGGTPASETEILISLLSHPETKNSVAATMTLGSLPQPTPEVAQALLTVMNTTDDELKRAAAAEALGELRVSDALVVSGLIALLSDNDLGVRQQAATALGRIGSASISALPALRAMAEQDPDPTIRLIAASAATAIENANSPPDCSGAVASPSLLWPPDHDLVEISVQDVTDPEGDTVSISITGVTQDEAVDENGSGNTCPDAMVDGGTTATVRAERAGRLDGRIYRLSFTASDSKGESCEGVVKVCMPHEESTTATCVEQSDEYDSTTCP